MPSEEEAVIDNQGIKRDSKGRWLESANPGGRPKRGESFGDIFEALLQGEPQSKAVIKTEKYRLAKAILDKAMKGSFQHFRELADRMEGKAVQHSISEITADIDLSELADELANAYSEDDNNTKG